MAEGPARGLELLDCFRLEHALAHYHLYHAARADLLRRAGRLEEARAEYQRALDLCQNAIERRFLLRRLRELAGASGHNAAARPSAVRAAPLDEG